MNRLARFRAGQTALAAPALAAPALAAPALAALALAAAGCGANAAPQPAADQPRTATPAATATAESTSSPGEVAPTTTPGAAATPERTRAPFEPVTCPPAPANCRTATGRVLYVEAVDGDGDGDAHYVLAGGDITAPGISVIDVRAGLRPRRLPRPGERVSAAGPVFPGSYGQRQIEAIRLRHDRP